MLPTLHPHQFITFGDILRKDIMQRKSIEVSCATCGKVKSVPEYVFRINKTGNFFCDCHCAGQWRSKNYRGENHPNWTKVEVTCSNCGKKKWVHGKRIERVKMFFCDTKCQMQWNKVYKSGSDSPLWKRTEVQCVFCGKVKLVKDCEMEAGKNGRFFCNQICQLKWRIQSGFAAKENNVNWKGGDETILYDDFEALLVGFEPVRRDPHNEKLLQVKCAYCGRWFIPPSRKILWNRAAWFDGRKPVESRFYCDSSCKHNCSDFGQTKFPKGFQQASSREVQPELRKLVLERDQWQCQKCNDSKNLHCHHIDPVALNPVESADVDNCICLCKKCHVNVHKQHGCRPFELRCA
jgi:5-methylcytosine-specific restriction endonuclease McrA